jgi:hypothetical protein
VDVNVDVDVDVDANVDADVVAVVLLDDARNALLIGAGRPLT